MAKLWYDGLTHVQRAFIVLLRSGLWETSVEEVSLFPLSEADWHEVFRLSQQQTVQGLLYRSFQHLPSHLHPPQSLVMQWVVMAARLEKEYKRFAQATEATRLLLTEAGLQPVLQKGISVAAYYEHPELRVNGDIDWYIGEEVDTDTICDFLKAKGYTSEVRADRSICFEYQDIDVELHRQLFDLDAPRHRKAANENYQLSTVNCQLSTLNSQLSTLLMLNAHILKHVCTVGIGLRQFCDMARAYHTLFGTYDAEQLTETYRQTGLLKWSGLMHQVLVHVLGLSADEVPTSVPALTSDGRKLIRKVLHWGNFGHYTSAGQLTKLHTLRQIICQLPFSLRYAPIETAYKIKNLIIGQKYLSNHHE